jgi:hypothetical protein
VESFRPESRGPHPAHPTTSHNVFRYSGSPVFCRL